MDERKINAIVAHYNEIQKRIDNYNTKATNIAIVIITLVCAILGANLLKVEKEYKIIIYFVIPLVTLVGHYQFSTFARYESVLQGYSAYLERQINLLMQDNIFCWNSKYLDSYIVPKHFFTNRMSSPVFSCFVFLPNVYVFYALFATCFNEQKENVFLLICSILLLITYVSISAVFVYDCTINDSVRHLAANGEIEEKIRNKKKILDV